MKERLQAIIFQRGYDNERLAEKLGITKQELHSKMNEKNFTIEEIINLTAILRIKNPENIFFPKREQKTIK